MNLIMFTDDIGEKHTIALTSKEDAVLLHIRLKQIFANVDLEMDK